jgi:hypothetical protein
VLTESPSVLQFKRGRGWWWCADKRKPPSVSHFERGSVDRENPSVSQFKRGRGWWWCADKRKPSSVSHFERGRGVLTENPSVSQFERGRGSGGVLTKEIPSVSRFERGRGGGCVDREPLRLAIQAREGLVVACWQKKPPPSRVLSEGGVGGDVSAEETPLRLAFRAREGWRWWWCVDRKTTPLRLASRAREGVEMVVAVCQQRNYPSVSPFE